MFARRTSALLSRGVVGILASSLVVSAPARADDSIAPPQPISRLHVEYPERATGEHDVLLELLVAADGSVAEARVVEGQTPFSDAALAAAKGFRFTPARRGDRPVRARIRASIHFTPPPPPAPKPTPKPEPPRAAPLEVAVVGDPRAPGAVALRRAEVRVLPGAFGDPFRAIETLPGVTPTASGSPYFYVRGAPPGNVGYFLDDIRLPGLFHILLGPAVVPPALIDRVELFPGGYPAQYGRFAGGVVAAKTRPPATELHAEGSLRLIDAGALVETPLPGGHGSALVGGRYSYTSAALSLFTSDVRFNYWDYQARVALDISPRDRLTLFVFGSHDDSAARRGATWKPFFVSDLHRVDLRYETSLGERTKVTHGLTFGHDRTISGFDIPSARDTSLAARSRVIHSVSDTVLLRAGADAVLDSYSAGEGTVTWLFADALSRRLDLAAGVFVDAVVKVGRAVEITPGLRLDLWGSRGRAAISADPRLAVRVALGDRVHLVDAVGLAHQAPSFGVQVPGLNVAGLLGGLQRSVQTSTGVEVDLPLSFRASATLFYNAFFNLTDPFGSSGVPTSLDQTWTSLLPTRALGSAVGLELHVERKLTERLGGFLSYTLSRSNRYGWYLSSVARTDRAHVLQSALSWDIGRGFRAGARATLFSGRPILPPFSDLLNATREPPFFRLDARAEKRWTIGKRGWISVVLEMLNATLSKEPNGNSVRCTQESVCWMQGFGPVTMPSIGVEGGF